MTSTIDLDAIDAIDVHVHTGPSHSVADIAAYYRERRMACAVFTVDSMAARGRELDPTNEQIAELAAEHRDVVIPFASIDPARGRAGAQQARRLIEDYGVQGFKFHPSAQEFYPNDRAAYGLYEVIAEHGKIALFHSGHTAVGAGRPGGDGIRLKYSNPMLVDDVAVDFPDMPIILAHPSFPWQDEALSVAWHKPSVHIDLSGWSPKYFQPQLIHYANTLLKNKILFGSDYPMLTPERWMTDFEKVDFRDEVRPLIMKDNAARLFGLDGAAG